MSSFYIRITLSVISVVMDNFRPYILLSLIPVYDYVCVLRSGVRRQKFFRIVKSKLKLLLQSASKSVESALDILLYFNIYNARITNACIN